MKNGVTVRPAAFVPPAKTSCQVRMTAATSSIVPYSQTSPAMTTASTRISENFENAALSGMRDDGSTEICVSERTPTTTGLPSLSQTAGDGTAKTRATSVAATIRSNFIFPS